MRSNEALQMMVPEATDNEQALVIFIDEACSPVHVLPLRGRPGHVALPMRTIVEEALVRQCRFLLLYHSHGAGDPSPSPDDILTTRLLCRLLKPLHIRLADHVIYAGKRRFSFRQSGLL